MASTTVLPPPTCTAWQEAGQLHQLAVLLQGLCRSDRLLAVFLLQGLCRSIICRLFACLLTFAMPCLLPTSTFCPVLFCISPPLVHCHVHQDRLEVCKDCPVGSYNTGLQWRPVHRLTFVFLPAESIDPGPWFSVKFVRLSCIVYECAPGMYVLAPAIYSSRLYEWVC